MTGATTSSAASMILTVSMPVRMPSRSVTALVRAFERPGFCKWAFDHYLQIAPPSFVQSGPPRAERSARVRTAPAAV